MVIAIWYLNQRKLSTYGNPNIYLPHFMDTIKVKTEELAGLKVYIKSNKSILNLQQ